jgi:DNA-binding transcriptional regulator LsrR (DeoR family)
MYKAKGNTALLAQLAQAGCVGDLMWRPFGPDGPIELKSGSRAMTLVELSTLPKMIAAGKWVLAVLGPCVSCGKPKTGILLALLGQRSPFLTDIVVDSVTARAVLSVP